MASFCFRAASRSFSWGVQSVGTRGHRESPRESEGVRESQRESERVRESQRESERVKESQRESERESQRESESSEENVSGLYAENDWEAKQWNT